nr:hypothetical protein CTI12_AA507900 [Tanacetum cinerariifolium]
MTLCQSLLRSSILRNLLVKTNHPLDDVAHVIEQFEHDHKVNVKIYRMTTDGTWLNKLVGNGTFIEHIENSNPNLQGRFLLKVEDPDDELVESKFKAKKNVSCPSFNPDTHWNECKPVLGMRFESPQQLHMLANYGVQHGYQLWYIQNDHNEILVFYGRNVSEGKRAGLKGKKPITIDNEECESRKQSSKKGDGTSFRTPNTSIRFMKNNIKETYWIDISLGQCQRAKQCALFDHEGGLLEHYSKLWQYRQAILDTNPGSTCELETKVNDEDVKLYFRRFYVCFHGVKHGWIEGCRKIIGLDGCFLTYICNGKLLTAMDRDANN